MSYATIVGMLVPGSPEQVTDVSGDYVVYRYRGITATLVSNRPAYNAAWGASSEYAVRAVRGPTRLERGTHSEMIVEVATLSVGGSTQVTNNEYPAYEIDYVTVENDLLAHPAFAGFSAAERHQCKQWREEVDDTARSAFQYWNRDKDGAVTGSIQTLGTGASPTKSQQDWAAMILQGIESYQDFNPVARKTSLYQGEAAPAVSDIGSKLGGSPFAGVPSGYEWLETGDAARKQGGGFTWTRVQEWKGARKVKVDVDTIYP